jgi:hypothetical protein
LEDHFSRWSYPLLSRWFFQTCGDTVLNVLAVAMMASFSCKEPSSVTADSAFLPDHPALADWSTDCPAIGRVFFGTRKEQRPLSHRFMRHLSVCDGLQEEFAACTTLSS